MTSTIRLVLAATSAVALTVAAATPAAAQDDVAQTFDFEVDRTDGRPGTLVRGQVDPDDIAELCVTDLEEFRSVDGPFVGGLDEAVEVALGSGEIFGQDPPVVPESFEELTAVLYAVLARGVAADPELAQHVHGRTFVMNFIDDSARGVGELGSLDPETGEGSVIVPDIEPGVWLLAAACVSPSPFEPTIRAALAETAAFLEGEVDLSGFGFSEPFPTADELLAGLGDEEFVALLQEILRPLVGPLMQPDGYGLVSFCVLDAQGRCPPGVVPPLPPPPEPPKPEDEPTPAEPVIDHPSFTG